MKKIFILAMILFSMRSHAQTLITGCVRDNDKKPLTGANIYIRGTYTGATSDTNGIYRISTAEKDTQVLVASYVGYSDAVKAIILNGKRITVDFQLEESSSELDQVVITAGTFEAGDKKRAVLLSSLDIVTTANAEGDIYGALNMLPGAQTEGETGKIIVRGGESDEMKTFMDGMLIASPYTSRLPDIPARGRFSPFLFNGIMFSTGGYSAEYGQALSSVLELNTDALAEKSLTSLSFLNVGLGLSHTHRAPNASYTFDINYNNLALFFAMAKHDLDWIKVPESYGGEFRFRQKTGKTGMIKTFVSYSKSTSLLNYTNYSRNTPDRLEKEGTNLFQSTTYNTTLNENWLLTSGFAFGISGDNMKINRDNLNDKLSTCHVKLGFLNTGNTAVRTKFGIESLFTRNRRESLWDELPAKRLLQFTDNLAAGYVESDLRLLPHLAIRAGMRSEYSTYIRKMNFAPRVSLAYKISDNSQVSVAWGRFYQHVRNDFLLLSDSMKFEHAAHYILNFQVANNNRLLRIEAYHKQYGNLIKYQYNDSVGYSNLSNEGYGIANGIDIFWRDKHTFQHADYWISYSFIDTRRKYRDYPIEAVPEFVSKHNLSVVYKYWFTRLETQLSLSYKLRSGRTYYNPNNPVFLTDKTSSFNDISLAVSHLTNVFGNFTIVYLSCNNLFGFKNVFGYHYETVPDASGLYQAHPLQAYARRTFIIGIFISIK